MAEYVVMPKADYEAACTSIRAKTGKAELIKSGDMSTEIDSITGGGSAEGCVTVTFMNGNVELFSRPVYIGDDCPDPVAQGRVDTPIKESTAQYDYTHYGWGASDGGAADDTILQNITEDKTVYAIFTATARLYTITWLDSDGVTVLKTEKVAYGTVPSYTPSKDGVSFSGWEPTPVAVTGDASYTAKWDEKVVFATGSWADIIRIAESGEAAQHFAVGDTRDIQIGDYTIPFMIAGFNHDDLSDGSGKAGISIVAKELYPVAYEEPRWAYVYPSGETDWHREMNNLLSSVVDLTLRSAIKSVVKQAETSSSGNASVVQCDCHIWKPSMIELGPTSNVYSSTKYNILGATYEAFTNATDMRRTIAGSTGYGIYRARNTSTTSGAAYPFYQDPTYPSATTKFRRTDKISNGIYPLLGFCI